MTLRCCQQCGPTYISCGPTHTWLVPCAVGCCLCLASHAMCGQRKMVEKEAKTSIPRQKLRESSDPRTLEGNNIDTATTCPIVASPPDMQRMSSLVYGGAE